MPASMLPTGKLPPKLLDELLARHSRPDPRVVLGPRAGEDAAIIDMGDRYLVAKTDPITFATDEIGWYAVNVNANDVACCGAVPKWFLATLLLPEQRTDAALVERVFAQIADACAALDVTLCGGHTEITYGLDRPIVVGQMLGEVAPDACLSTSGARPGDALILTKGIAVEGDGNHREREACGARGHDGCGGARALRRHAPRPRYQRGAGRQLRHRGRRGARVA